MKGAIMQPYIFPYLGYFQLIQSADQFVFLDDVNFIKKGWINRNKFKLSNVDYFFTIPLVKVSQNKLIKDTYVVRDGWQSKFLKTIETAYSKSHNFEEVYHLIEETVSIENETTISEMAINSIRKVYNYLGIDFSFIRSSNMSCDDFKAQTRIIELCKQQGIKEYVNPPGGKSLYCREDFKKEGLGLSFLKPQLEPYGDEGNWLSGLSVIDLLFTCDKAECVAQFDNFIIENQ